MKNKTVKALATLLAITTVSMMGTDRSYGF